MAGVTPLGLHGPSSTPMAGGGAVLNTWNMTGWHGGPASKCDRTLCACTTSAIAQVRRGVAEAITPTTTTTTTTTMTVTK